MAGEYSDPVTLETKGKILKDFNPVLYRKKPGMVGRDLKTHPVTTSLLWSGLPPYQMRLPRAPSNLALLHRMQDTLLRALQSRRK